MKPTVSLDKKNRIVVDPNWDMMNCYTTGFVRPYPGLHYEPHLGAILSYPFIAPFGKATLFLWKVGNKHLALKEKRLGVGTFLGGVPSKY